MGTLFDWSTTAASNTTIDGVNVAENCAPGNINNAIRSIAALVRNTFSSGLQNFLAGSAALPVANGGTAATTASAARTALGAAASGANSDITSLTGLTTPLAVARGGTGGATATAARTALGALGLTSATFGANTISLSITLSNGDTLLVQGGKGTLGANTFGSITFGTAYSTAPVVLVGGGASSTSTEGDIHLYSAASTTGVSIVNSASASGTYTWLAIGKA